MINPLHRSIIVDATTGETLYINAVMSIDGEHYAVYSPLVTSFPMEDVVASEFEEDMHPFIQFVGVGRVVYDYEKFTAVIEPLHEELDYDMIDGVLALLGYVIE